MELRRSIEHGKQVSAAIFECNREADNQTRSSFRSVVFAASKQRYVILFVSRYIAVELLENRLFQCAERERSVVNMALEGHSVSFIVQVTVSRWQSTCVILPFRRFLVLNLPQFVQVVLKRVVFRLQTICVRPPHASIRS